MENASALLLGATGPWLQAYADIPLFPVFSIPLFILSALALRAEPGSHEFAHKHPVGSCVLTYCMTMSGTILASLASGRPFLEFVSDQRQVISGVIIWYLTFFSPLDVFPYLCALRPLQLLLLVMGEFGRAKKVMSGVLMAHTLYPSSLIAMAIAGMLKGSGKRWTVSWYRLFVSPRSAGSHELLGISLITKSTFILGLFFAFNLTTRTIPPPLLLFTAGCLLAFMKLNSSLFGTDPYQRHQTTVWSVLTHLSVLPPQSSTGEGEGGEGEGVRGGEEDGEGVKARRDGSHGAKHIKAD